MRATIIWMAVAGAMLLPGLAQAQTTAEAAVPAAAPTPSATWVPNTLLKLGTGLNRQSGYGAYSGLQLPILFGAEYQLRPALSLYANLAPMMALRGRSPLQPDSYLDCR